MSRPLHNDPEQNISANEGWQDMQLLLEKHLPVMPAPVRRKPFLFYFAAASFIGVLMLSYLKLQESNPGKSIIADDKNTAAVSASGNNEKSATGPSDIKFSPTAISSAVFDNGRPKGQEQAAIRYMAERKRKDIYSTIPVDFSGKIPAGDYMEDNIDPVATSIQATRIAAIKNMELLAGKGYAQPAALRMYDGKPDMKNPLPGYDAAVKADKKHRKGYWETGIGAGSNAVLDNEVNLRPYPVGEVKYNFSPKIFVSAGLTAFSPVNSHSRSINKTVYVNDTASNLRSYNEIVNYTRFEYADVPVMVGFRLNKHIAVQAGAQASILIGQKKRQNVDGYDFQMNPSYPVQNPVTMSPVSSDVFEAKPRKVDGRMTGGISYTREQISVSLNYQQALRAAVKGSQVSSNKNRLVSLQVLYRLKK